MSEEEKNYHYSISDLFEVSARKQASKIALKDHSTIYTYASLNERANQIAHCLRKKFIRPNDFVVLLLEPGADFILFILAIIKIGAVYVPVDTLAPPQRLKEIIEDAQPKLVITNEEGLTKLKTIKCTTSLVKQINMESISYSNKNLKTSISPDSPIYMMYTSGSTGKPKGVIISHRAVANLVKVDNYAGVQEGEVLAQLSNLAFDGSTFEIWSAFLNGAILCIVPLSARSNHNELQDILQKNGVNYLFLPTGFFHQLIKSAPHTLDSVNTIIFGGEQINNHLVRTFLHFRKQQQNPVALINGYGPTEATTFTCKHLMTENSVLTDEQLSSIGFAISNVKTYILDEQLNEASEGELHISGINLALGYHNSVHNQKKFITNPYHDNQPSYDRLYKTGDKVRLLPSGELLCLGRLDDQVKIGGFRIHLNEIEQQLMKHPDVSQAAVAVELGGGFHQILTAYLVFSENKNPTHADDIRAFLSELLPPYMLPTKYVMVDEFPLTAVGKIDRKSLNQLAHTDLSFHVDASSSSSIEEQIKKIWQYLLNRSSIEIHKNLFDLGANSLLITEACSLINQSLQCEIHLSEMLAYPTIHKLSRYLEGDIDHHHEKNKKPIHSTDIAVIGMSCRLPKANNINEFWDNLCQGIDCLTRFDTQQLKMTSIAHNFVPVKGILTNIDYFDAPFFGFSPVDARITDPQHRVFLECVWEALEHAAVAPEKTPSKTISVFAGMTDSTYLQENLLKSNWFCNEHDSFQQRIATSISMLSTQVSYRLNLKGRSINVNTACSTGLMTIDHACQDLLMGHSDIALAGASSIVVPQEQGYLYQEGSIVSQDGYCRPFSNNANGTVFSNGVGVVVLKRLSDAIEDGDTIYAVIKSRSVNNDGLDKLGFTAPSLSGQISCIREALEQAQIRAEDIGLLEAHGTATALGDLIEINALTSVYREQCNQQGYCALGSVKANIGHTDVTAGIAGFIKTVLCLYHKKIPPLINFNAPNPELGLEQSPFFVNKELIDWNNPLKNRYAAISAFGVGGTNAHLILSDYKQTQSSVPSVEEALFLLSASSQKALKQRIHQFYEYTHTIDDSSVTWADAAYTLQTGREDFQWRQYVVSKDSTEFQQELIYKTPKLYDDSIHHSIVWMINGQGTQYHQMGIELYYRVPLFRHYVDQGIELAKPYLNVNLMEILNHHEPEQLKHTQYTQPLLFIIEYALSQLLLHCDIQPDILIGHSLGEYVAACMAGVFSFEDGVALVCERGLLMAKAKNGSMLALECTEEELLAFKELASVDIALHNATNHWVLSGAVHEIEQLERHLSSMNISFHRLKVSHAFHSRLMEPLEHSFKDIFSNITLYPPKIPIVSNVTGTWLSATEAQDPDYWYRHGRHTVQFCKGVQLLLRDQHPFFVEIGLGQGLCSFVKKTSAGKAKTCFTLPGLHKQTSDMFQLYTCFGELWLHGVKVESSKLFETEKRQHIPLPTYPFQKQRYWIEPDKSGAFENKPLFYQPTWSYRALNHSLAIDKAKKQDWIIITNKNGLGTFLIEFLLKNDIKPFIIESGTKYKSTTPRQFEIDPTNESHYAQIVKNIKPLIQNPIIVHTLSCEHIKNQLLNQIELTEQLNKGFYSLLYISKAYINEINASIPMRCIVVSTGAFNILGTDTTYPVNASLIGACRVIPMEHPSMYYQFIDIESNDFNKYQKDYLLDLIQIGCDKKQWNFTQDDLAYRNGYRWERLYSPIPYQTKPINFTNQGVYLITGGLGGIGLALSEAIAKQASNPILILCSRNFNIPESKWEQILQSPSHKFYSKILRLKHLKSLGAKIYCIQLDISNSREVDSLFELIKSKFKSLNGIIHSAGIAGGGLSQLKSRDTAHKVFLPKIYGTYNLAQACKQLPPLDFVVFMSSIAAITGEKGQIDYCGANACLDAFSISNIFPSKLTLSINWNTWREVGMSVETRRPDDMNLFDRGNSIGIKEGQLLFLNALAHQCPNIIVSNYDLHKYSELVHEDKDSSDLKKQVVRDTLGLKNTYSSPINDLESTLADLWQNHLHIEKIGRNDDFFALGGHSLKAINLIEQINSTFQCSLSIQHLYQAPTIEKFCHFLTNKHDDSINVIVNLKSGAKTDPTIFFFHPISGMIYCFNSLASQWNIPTSIYAIQDPSISKNKLLYRNLSEIAACYVKHIKEIQPHGPYLLVGYSFGGTIAYEVANILKQENQSINLLGLIESWCIFSKTQYNERHFINNYLSKELQSNPKLAKLAWARMQLLLKHTPSTMNQDIILFKATELGQDYESIDHPLNGWSKFNKGQFICHSIKANHDSIISDKNIPIILCDYIKTHL